MGTRASTLPASTPVRPGVATQPPRIVHRFVEPPLIQPARQAAPTAKDSIAATALTLFYVAVYIAVGFAAFSVLRWVWLRLFG